MLTKTALQGIGKIDSAHTMNTKLCILLALAMMTSHSFGQSENLTNLLATIPSVAKDIPGFQELARTVASLDPEQAAILTTETPDVRVQAVIVFAAQRLKPRQYLRFTEQIVELGSSEKVPYQIVAAALYPEGELANLLIDNYTDPQVRRILNSSKQVFKQHEGIAQGIDSVLNGESKTYFDKQREHVIPEARPKPPVLLDQDSSDAP